MKKQKLNLRTLSLLLLATSFILTTGMKCKKDIITDNIYNGIVKRELNNCSGEGGPPLVIYISNNITYDSVSTLTLPNKYWIPEKKIKLKIRELKNGDNYIPCSLLINIPKPVVVFDVTEN